MSKTAKLSLIEYICLINIAVSPKGLFTIILSCRIFDHLATLLRVAMIKEHKLLLHPPFFHSDYLVIKVQITIW